MRTSVYVDGFNLYFGCLKRTPYKWLDLAALCRNILLPVHQVDRIRYFTAMVKPMVKGGGTCPEQVRQQTYLRALKTNPIVVVHLGSFQSNPCKRPRVSDGTLVEVIDTKEKGSDVNLAAYLLRDGFKGEYDAAVVISNDSDLATPVRMVRKELGLVVGILNPHANHAYSLQHTNPKFHMHITPAHLTASQFPATLTDTKGTITKPAPW
jgi:uncharacterized LabA/DUF88 family protein